MSFLSNLSPSSALTLSFLTGVDSPQIAFRKKFLT